MRPCGLLVALMTCFLLSSVAPAQAQPAPEERILAGYGGAWFGDEGQRWRDYPSLMAARGFNTLDLKLGPPDFDMQDDAFGEFVAEVAKVVDDAGLGFYAYLYDKGPKRDPENPDAPAFVGPDGVTYETMYCLYQPESWVALYERVFYLANLSLKLPIKGVKIDIERVINHTPCVCDACFGSFARARDEPVAAAEVPPAERWAWIEAHGGNEAYLAHLEERMGLCVQAYEQRAHEINPDLCLGVMPFADNFFSRPWGRFLATERAPAIIDAWPMYRGLGYTEAVAEQYRLVRELNPHNLYVPWFRINSYRPADMGAHAFVAAVKTDGYNMWVITMIHPSVADKPMKTGYRLPLQFSDPMQYWEELAEANRRATEWLRNPVEITWESIEPLAVSVDLTKVKVPGLRPLETDQPDPEQPPAPTGLRGENTLYLYVADPAETIRVSIRHLAGKARPSPLAYALVSELGAAVAEGLVQPGETAELSLKVEKAGTYALPVTATVGGGPWYNVKVHSHPYVVETAGKAYFFRSSPRQYFYVPAEVEKFHVRAETGGNSQEMWVRVWRPDGEVAVDHVVNSDVKHRETLEIEVPEGADDKVWSLEVGKPEQMASAHYSENYWVRLQGIPPYLADRPGALLVPAQ